MSTEKIQEIAIIDQISNVEELKAMEPSKAEQIRHTFALISDEISKYESQYSEIMSQASKEITKDLCAQARRLRLDIRGLRTQAEKVRKEKKEEFLLAGKAIDGVANIIKWGVSQKEERLEEVEQHFERKAQAERDAIQSQRAEALLPYLMGSPAPASLHELSEEVFQSMLEGQKVAFERKRAEDEAAAKQAAILALRDRRTLELGRYSDYIDISCVGDLGEMSQEEYAELLKTASDARETALEAQRKEKAEAEEAKRIAREAEEKIRAAQEAEEAKKRAEAESKAREAALKEGERLKAWIEKFQLPELAGDETPASLEIREKFEGLKSWAYKLAQSVK